MDLTATEVIRIMQACRKTGVHDFSLGELKLSFGPKPEPTAADNPPDLVQNEEDLRERELELKQSQLDELRISDPYAYEQMICMDNDKQDKEQSLGTQ